MMSVRLAGITTFSVVRVGVVLRATVDVTVVVFAVGIVRISGTFGGNQWLCACVRVGIVGAVFVRTKFVVFILPCFRTVVGDLLSTVGLAVHFVDMTGDSMESAVGVFVV